MARRSRWDSRPTITQRLQAEQWFNGIQFTLLTVTALATLWWFVLQTLDFFFFREPDSFLHSPWVALVFLGVVALSYVGIWFLSRRVNRPEYNGVAARREADIFKWIIDDCFDDHSKVIDLFVHERSNGRADEALELGVVASKLFWATAKYELRLENGRNVRRLAEEMAVRERDPSRVQKYRQIVAETLIDDLGYTYIELGTETDLGRSHIEEGMRIADEIGDQALKCKALRHLAGIRFKQAEQAQGEARVELLEAARGQLEQYKSSLRRIRRGTRRNVLEAYYHYLDGCLKLEEPSEGTLPARDAMVRALEIFERLEDLGRASKCCYRLGRILEGVDRGTLDTVRAFEKGFRYARESGRNDQLLGNGIHLCRLAANSGDIALLQRIWPETEATARKLGRAEVIEELTAISTRCGLVESV